MSSDLSQSKNKLRLKYDPGEDLDQLEQVLHALIEHPPQRDEDWRRILRKHPKPNGGFFGKPALIAGARRLVSLQRLDPIACHKVLRTSLRMKPTRTQSGVSTVTVLTKPYPCPGQCIFCPNDVKMPKSYLADEPGAQRAANNRFDPYAQTWNRLLALHNIGHPIEKIELIVLGGTWSAYTLEYRKYFIARIFEAANDFGERIDAHLSLGGAMPQAYAVEHLKQVTIEANQQQQAQFAQEKALNVYNQVVSRALRQNQEGQLNSQEETASWQEIELLHQQNVNARCRIVGLAVETRPDEINAQEIDHLRRLGATKIQLGVQSLSDEVLALNRRGHTVNQAQDAASALRSAGFKLHLHWMANLYGSSPQDDVDDYHKLFTDQHIRPDELKLYPCSLIPDTPLMAHYQAKRWRPYTREELLELLCQIMPSTPSYCRLTRVIRDIPSTDIHAGNQETNFREVAEAKLATDGIALKEIRAREVRGQELSTKEPNLHIERYQTAVSEELFLSYLDAEHNYLLGFCRLSLPKMIERQSPQELYLSEVMRNELRDSAIIREVHVYGQSLKIDEDHQTAAQHRGFGRTLVQKAKELSKAAGYKNLAVISAIGTRAYYEKLGFKLASYYQHCAL